MNTERKTQIKALITGASTGIGRGLSLRLAKEKAELVLTARSETALLSLKEECQALGARVDIVSGDIADGALAEKLIETSISSMGGLNLLVNNAGMARPGSFEKLSVDDWRRVFEVNFFSALTLSKLALPHLKEAAGRDGFAKIVNISSVAGKISFPGSLSYCASKFALTALSEGLAAEFYKDKIDVITVCPGWVRTEFFEKNGVPPERNPNEIAAQGNLRGFLMKHLMSISTDECVKDIARAIFAGGSREIILTLPGLFAERMQGLTPGLMSRIARTIPPNYSKNL